jgi:hypothetical protein
MSHSFLPWMRHWARMVNNNRYGLLIKEHGRITRASSRLRSAPLRFAQCRSAQRLKRIPLGALAISKIPTYDRFARSIGR